MAEQTPAPDVLPLSDEELKKWKGRIQASQDLIDDFKDEWDENKNRYLLKKQKGQHKSELLVPKDFAFVEQKKSQLFFQTPQIMLSPLVEGVKDAEPIFEAVVNHYLGPNGVNVKFAIDEVLSDALCTSGVFAVKVGYEATIDGTKQVQVGEEPDPNWVPTPEEQFAAQQNGTPLQPPMVPKYADAPNIICQKYIYERISPVKLLLPPDFTSSDFDKAAYIGFEFLMDAEIAKRAFKLPDDFNNFANEDERLIGEKKSAKDAKRKLVRGWEIYYKTSIFDAKVKHPEHQRILVIIEGVDKPVIHKDSPYQQQLPDGTIGGMPGFPIHVGALRYMSDSPLPPSDSSMSKYQVEEISKGRTTQKIQRERSVPMRVADVAACGGPDGLAKIEKNIWQGIIPLDSIDPLPIKEIPRSTYPNENFEFDKIATADLHDVWALGANPTGALNPTNRTATELALAQNASGDRLGKERNKFMDWFVRSVEKLAALIQMFADEQSYVSITGPDGAKRIATWDKTTIQGRFAFAIKPNSFAPVDAAAERAEFLQLYDLLANSPNVNKVELEAELVRKFGLDPAKLLAPPPPPPPPAPEPPRVSVSIDENCLTPNHPGFPVFLALLKARGVEIPQEAIDAATKAAAEFGQMTGLPVANGSTPVAPAAPAAPQAPQGSTPGEPQKSAEGAVHVNAHQEERTGERTGPKPGGFARLNEEL